MGIKEISIQDTQGVGGNKSNYNDMWLRDLVMNSVQGGYEQEFVTPVVDWVINHGRGTMIFTYLAVDLLENQLDEDTMVNMHIDSEDQFTITWALPQSGRIRVAFGFDGWVYPAQSEIGYPTDGNWGDGITPPTGPGAILPTDTIADAIDKVNEAAKTPPPGVTNDLQSAYNNGEYINVDIGTPVLINSGAGVADTALILQQEGATGYPLRIINDGAAFSVYLDDNTPVPAAKRAIGTSSGDLYLITIVGGDIKFESVNNVMAKLGDNAGAYSFFITDSADVTVFDVNSDGHVTCETLLADANVYSMQASEPYTSRRPKTWVNSADGHLYFTDSTGTHYDLITAALGENRDAETFIVDGTIQTNNYIDLADTPATDSEFVYLDGVALAPGAGYDYVVGPVPTYRVFFNASWSPLPLGAIIHVKYSKDNAPEEWEDEVFAPNGNQYVDVSFLPVGESETVFANGVALVSGSGNDYLRSGQRINFYPGVKYATTVIRVKYRYYP